MAFVVDRERHRTYDPERGYELFKRDGGSDGTDRFELQGPEGHYFFSANTYQEELRPDERARLGPSYDNPALVWCIHNWNDHWKPIIREAMAAYKFVHGSAYPNLIAFVRFGLKESEFDA